MDPAAAEDLPGVGEISEAGDRLIKRVVGTRYAKTFNDNFSRMVERQSEIRTELISRIESIQTNQRLLCVLLIILICCTLAIWILKYPTIQQANPSMRGNSPNTAIDQPAEMTTLITEVHREVVEPQNINKYNEYDELIDQFRAEIRQLEISVKGLGSRVKHIPSSEEVAIQVLNVLTENMTSYR